MRDSELARLRVGEPERLAYGPAEIERLARERFNMVRPGEHAYVVDVICRWIEREARSPAGSG